MHYSTQSLNFRSHNLPLGNLGKERQYHDTAAQVFQLISRFESESMDHNYNTGHQFRRGIGIASPVSLHYRLSVIAYGRGVRPLAVRNGGAHIKNPMSSHEKAATEKGVSLAKSTP